MRLAVPLLVLLAAQLSACAQSSRTPEVSSEPAGQRLADMDRRLADKRSLSTAPPSPSEDDACAYRSAKGIAEVVGIEEDRILLRFYPGDRLFVQLKQAMETPAMQVGDEFRAWRQERVSGTCEMISYRIQGELPLSTGREG